jgi:hypothetical protein
MVADEEGEEMRGLGLWVVVVVVVVVARLLQGAGLSAVVQLVDEGSGCRRLGLVWPWISLPEQALVLGWLMPYAYMNPTAMLSSIKSYLTTSEDR